ELAGAGCKGLAQAGRFVDAPGIQPDALPRLQRWRQVLGDLPATRRRLQGSLQQPGHVHPLGSERRHHRRMSPRGAWHGSGGALVMGCPAVAPGHGARRAALVAKAQLLWIERGDRLAPGVARLLVTHGTAATAFVCGASPAGGWPATSWLR